MAHITFLTINQSGSQENKSDHHPVALRRRRQHHAPPPTTPAAVFLVCLCYLSSLSIAHTNKGREFALTPLAVLLSAPHLSTSPPQRLYQRIWRITPLPYSIFFLPRLRLLML